MPFCLLGLLPNNRIKYSDKQEIEMMNKTKNKIQKMNVLAFCAGSDNVIRKHIYLTLSLN